MLVDPHDTSAITAGLVQLAHDEHLRRRLSMAGKVRAAAFTWDRTAAATIGVYRSLLG
jgi:glycosyltransferase involved in cell wall biosynthesis